MTTTTVCGVNHIGITVPDIEAAKTFLIEAFGGAGNLSVRQPGGSATAGSRIRASGWSLPGNCCTCTGDGETRAHDDGVHHLAGPYGVS